MMTTQPNAFSNDLNAKVAAFPANFRLGSVHGRGILFRRPSFVCNWYWGFGYLGNRDCHYHLDSLYTFDWQNKDMQNKNLYDQLKLHFGDTLTITDDRDLWKFCEIVRTIYTLRKTAELYHLGGSHFTTNPDAELLKNPEEWKRINEVLIPAQFASLYTILAKYPHEYR